MDILHRRPGFSGNSLVTPSGSAVSDTVAGWLGQAGLGASIYVDSRLGHDGNTGRHPLSPLKTLAAAAAIAVDGDVIGLAAGSEFREALTVTAANITVQRYGHGPNPRILGSTRIETAWTNVSGTIYSTPLAYTPVNVFWQSPVSGVVTKLRAGTAGALTSNQYAISGGNLQINIGREPSREWIEVPRNTSEVGVSVGNYSGHTYRGLSILFFPQSGMNFDASPNHLVEGCVVSFNGNDGIDMTHAAATGTIRRCIIQQNGLTRGLQTGPGDGISGHQGSTTVIEYCSIIDNERNGIGNLESCFITARYNYFDNNNVSLRAIAGDTTVGSHRFHHNLILCNSSSDAIAIDSAVRTATVVEVYNNTIVNIGAQGSRYIAINAAGQFTIRNNIVSNFVFGFAHFGGGTSTSSNNLWQHDGMGGTWFKADGNAAITNPGTGEKTGNPQFVNAAAGNYRLLTASPAKNAGASLGFAQDRDSNPVPYGSAPDMGCYERQAA